MHLQYLQQKMLSDKEWLAFFHNIKYKQCLFSSFVTYLFADDFIQPSPLPILVNNESETVKISFECNHEEADTKMILHALQQRTNVLAFSKDRNILVSMVFVILLHFETIVSS